jgi:hypothetical protein
MGQRGYNPAVIGLSPYSPSINAEEHNPAEPNPIQSIPFRVGHSLLSTAQLILIAGHSPI